MSVKLYDGFKTNLRIIEIRKKLLELKPKVDEVLANTYFNDLTFKAVELYDLNEKEIKPFNEIVSELYFKDKTNIYLKEPKDSKIDLRVEAYLFPLSNKTTLICMRYPTNCCGKLDELFSSQDWLEDYHYQNNSDKPKDISTKKWNKRYKDWKEAFGSDNTLWMCEGYGLSLTLHSKNEPLYNFDLFEEVSKYIPTDKVRKTNILKKDEWQRKLLSLSNQEKQQETTLSLYIDWFNEFRTKFDEGGFQNELNEISLKEIPTHTQGEN